MIWLLLLVPVLILGAISIYFEKKSGMTPRDENTKKDTLTPEYLSNVRRDVGGPFNH